MLVQSAEFLSNGLIFSTVEKILMITNLSATDFCQKYASPSYLNQDPPDGIVGQPRTIYLEKAWLTVPLWYPITKEFHTCEELFQLYAPFKYAKLEGPSIFEFLKKHKDQLDRQTPLSDVFVLGGADNYYHFLFDIMPRLALLKWIPELQRLRLLIGTDLTRTQMPIVIYVFSQLDIPTKNISTLHKGFFPISSVFMPAKIGRETAISIWKNLILPPDHGPGPRRRRLFVERNNLQTRRVVNQDEVKDYLSRQDFDCIDPGELPFEEQIALFANANLIVGAHGAGLANILFAPSDCHFIELYGERALDLLQIIASLQGMTYE